jgi:ketosteroid isomerase-like protein
MKKQCVKVRMAIINAIVLSGLLVVPVFAANDGEKAVKAASTQFYAALNAMFTGNTGPMKEIWSHADDTVYMGPFGETQKGWKQVLAQWEKQAAMKLAGKVTPDNMTIVLGKDLAVVYDLEKGQNKDSSGKFRTVSIRATNVFRLENGKWKMISHHTDKLE